MRLGLLADIREKDKRHLITVGLVAWSLDRPGLTSGFVPAKIADDLDFLSAHLDDLGCPDPGLAGVLREEGEGRG